MSVALTSGELRMLKHARDDVQEAAVYLTQPVQIEDLHSAKRRCQQAVNSLEYLIKQHGAAREDARPTRA
jgi:wobble nucleotide-excising tRNase